MVDDFFEDNPSKIKRAVIAGAAEALKAKASDWKKSDDVVLQDITDRIEEILEGKLCKSINI